MPCLKRNTWYVVVENAGNRTTWARVPEGCAATHRVAREMSTWDGIATRDAELIVVACNLAPALVAEVRKLRAQVANIVLALEAEQQFYADSWARLDGPLNEGQRVKLAGYSQAIHDLTHILAGGGVLALTQQKKEKNNRG